VYDTVRTGLILKIAVFATGLAGVVAEFVLSTLATYLLGDAVFQWAVVMSLMLFAMGLGSRVSRLIKKDLLDAFILTEFVLSILCAAASCLAYGMAGRISEVGILIYCQALLIGGLIGLEIPLVTRLNQNYEELRINIASIMEKDYFGALLGGLLFAFFALPHLGLTYTPIALGAVNFSVAGLLLFFFLGLVKKKRLILGAFFVALICLAGLALFAEPIVTYGEQARYRDKVVFATQTPYQKIVITRWRQNHWLFLNGQEQFSTVDEHLYHEPLVHPVMNLTDNPERILIIGGGDGLALREVWKHKSVKSVVMVDLDPVMTGLAKEHPLLRSINRDSMHDSRLTVMNQDAGSFIKDDDRLYDVIIVDLPDPDSVDLSHLYSLGFYRRLKAHLTLGGALVTQAGSPFFAQKAYLCIMKTMQQAWFVLLPMHNHIPTMGEWGWFIAKHQDEISPADLRQKALQLEFTEINTRFLNNAAMAALVNFGKGTFDPKLMAQVEVNTVFKPVLPRYYAQGQWDIY
jgi:spermidine synthase